MNTSKFILLSYLLGLLVFVYLWSAEKEQPLSRFDLGPFADHEEWLRCQSDTDCTVFDSPLCDWKFPVNKRYVDQMREFVSEHEGCNSMPHYPLNTVAKCLSNVCRTVGGPHRVIIFPQHLTPH